MRFFKKPDPPSTLQQMEDSIHKAIWIPFNGKKVWVIARRLEYVDIQSCGDFSLIETLQDKINKRERKVATFDETVSYLEVQHACIRLSLENPNYDEVIDRILKYENVENVQDRLDEIREKFLTMEDLEEKSKLQEEYAMIELRYKYVLPADFLGHMYAYAVSLDNSDITKVSEDMLYKAALHAKLGNTFPTIGGRFTDFNKADIISKAWTIYYDRHKNDNSPLKKRA